MYIDLTLGISLVCCIGASLLLMAILAAIGWVNYAQEAKKNENLSACCFKQKAELQQYIKAEIIRIANEHARSVGNGE